jgi:uncharacterized membrane protein YkvA (DUF1232 family)
MVQRLRRWAKRLKTEIYALYLASRDPRTPLVARLVAGLVVAYALSPIDLIPDMVPVLGYLDDVILVPLGVMLALRLIPPDVLASCRAAAASSKIMLLRSRVGLAIVVTLWMVTLAVALWILLHA